MKTNKVILFIVLFCFVFLIGAVVGGDFVIKQQENIPQMTDILLIL